MAIKPQDLPKDYIITGVHVLEDKILGEGAYGVVKLGKYFSLLCAVKKLKASMFPPGMKQIDQESELILQSFYNECDKLSKIRHPNVVQLLGVYQDKRTHLPVIVMELMHESLSRLLFRSKSLPRYIEVNICHDVAQALAYLHSFRPAIVHRDLSSNNIMISQEYKAKITDLGVAKVAKGSFFSFDNTPAPGTLSYMPPEVRKIPADLSPSMDIFAVGVNIVQIVTHKFPKPGPEFVSGVLGFSKSVPEKERRKEHLDIIRRSHPLKAIALDCLRDSPKDRPSALKLCERLEIIMESKDYQESQQIAQVKGIKAEDTMEKISGLEQRLEQLKHELADRTTQLERAKADLEEERRYTAELLEQRAREQIEFGKMEMLLKRVDANGFDLGEELGTTASPKKKKKHFFKFSRPKKNKHKDGRPSDAAEAVITGSLGKEEDEENGEIETKPDEKPQPSPEKTRRKLLETPPLDGKTSSVDTSQSVPEETFIDVTNEMVEESEAEMVRRSYKVNRLNWYSHKCLPRGLQGSTLVVHRCGEKLYVCGGANKDGTPNKALYTCFVRNLTRWVKLSPDAPQYHCASAIVQDELVLISGLSSADNKCTGVLSSYDHKAQVWVQRFPPLPTPRSSAAAFVHGEYLIVVGGQNEDSNALSLVEVLHVPSHTWETATRLPQKVAGQSVAVSGDVVYLIGGSSGPSCLRAVFSASIQAITSSCHHFSLFESTDRISKVWKQLCDCPFTMMAATCNRGQLLALGGNEVTKDENHTAQWIWIYENKQNIWTPVQSMPSPRKLCSAAVLDDSSLIIVGGDPDFDTIDIAEFA